jgi:Tfp pilus assembly protein PilO
VSDQDKKVFQVAIVAGLFAAILVGYYYFVWAKKDIANERDKTAAKTEEIKAKQAELDTIVSYEANKEEVIKKLELVNEASRRLPSNLEDQSFLKNLNDMLSKARISQQLIESEDKVPRSLYTEIPWHISCTAQFFDFGPFLSMVEMNPKRFMRVKEFKIENDDLAPGYHPIDITIGTFMFNER